MNHLFVCWLAIYWYVLQRAQVLNKYVLSVWRYAMIEFPISFFCFFLMKQLPHLFMYLVVHESIVNSYCPSRCPIPINVAAEQMHDVYYYGDDISIIIKFSVSSFALLETSLQGPLCQQRGFLHSSVGKEFACNAGDMSSIPGSGRSPGEENGNPLQYSCLESHGQRTLVGYNPWGHKSRTQLSD